MPARRGRTTGAARETAAAARLLGQVEERTQLIGLINGVLRTMLRGAPLTDILRVFASNLKTLCPFDRCSVALYDADARAFRVPYMVYGGRVLETREAPRPYGSSSLAQAVETGRAVLRRDIRSATRRYPSDAHFIKKGFTCELLVPLNVGSRAVGTFNLACFEAGRLEDRHVALVQEIAPAITVAVWQQR